MSSSILFRVFVELTFVFTQFTGHFVQGQGRGAIRLFDNGNTSTLMASGIVQVYFDSEWNNICVPNGRYDYSSASKIVCNQLGYDNGELVTDNTKFGSDASPSAIILTSCAAGIGNILQCDYENSTSTDCNNKNDMAVHCSEKDRMMHFVDLTGFNGFTGSGAVLVRCPMGWGLVCAHGFKQADGNTVCQELGYTNAISVQGAIAYNISKLQPIWIDTPNCARFTYVTCFSFCKECPSTPLTSCPDNQFAYVTCGYIDGHRSGGNGCAYSISSNSSDGSDIGVIVGVICACIVVGCIIAVGVCVGCYFGVIKKRSHYNQL